MVREFTDEEHFVRSCSVQKQIRDADGNVLGVTWSAFELREKDNETYLSGSLLEHFPGTYADRLKDTLAAMRAIGLIISHKHVLAVCPAKKVRDCGLQQKTKLRVTHEQNKRKPAYSAIRRLPLDNSDRKLLELLASDAVADTVLVATI